MPKITQSQTRNQPDNASSNISGSTLNKTSFNYPYPVAWQESGATFSLIGISMGNMTIEKGLPEIKKPNGGAYLQGEKAYILQLHLKISTTRAVDCLPLNIRRLINEEGNLLAPSVTQIWLPGCSAQANQTYSDVRVPFVISPAEKEVIFTTGTLPKNFYSVKILDGNNVKVEKL